MADTTFHTKNKSEQAVESKPDDTQKKPWENECPENYHKCIRKFGKYYTPCRDRLHCGYLDDFNQLPPEEDTWEKECCYDFMECFIKYGKHTPCMWADIDCPYTGGAEIPKHLRRDYNPCEGCFDFIKDTQECKKGLEPDYNEVFLDCWRCI